MTYISLKDITPTELQCTFEPKNLDLGNDISLNVCTLKAVGKYPKGSQGAPIGEYLRGMAVFLREVYRLDALILNFIDLDYEWGNNLSRAIKPELLETNRTHDTWLGTYVLASDKNYAALKGLVERFELASPIFLDEAELIADIAKKGKELFED